MACLLPIIMYFSFRSILSLVDGSLKIERSSVCGGRAQGSDNYLRQCSMNVTLPQNSQGKGVAAVVPAAPF